jgi:hypothetical protein
VFEIRDRHQACRARAILPELIVGLGMAVLNGSLRHAE